VVRLRTKTARREGPGENTAIVILPRIRDQYVGGSNMLRIRSTCLCESELREKLGTDIFRGGNVAVANDCWLYNYSHKRPVTSTCPTH